MLQEQDTSLHFQPLLPIITTQSASTIESTRTGLNTSSLPVIKQRLKRSEVVKQSYLLCNRTEKWYTKKTKTQVQLRQTRLRWRQFLAILSHDKLELFHITKLKMKRLAHVIHFPSLSNKRANKVRLTAVSAIDGIWGLTYFHYKSKNPITFHFQAMQLSDAHDWYMALYQILPNEFVCKKPVPAYVDLFIPFLDNTKSGDDKLKIRIPLDSLSDNDANHHEYIYNISMLQVKRVVFRLLINERYIPQDWTFESVELCWSLDRHQEWVTDTVNTLLVGPQLIEQQHRLELRYIKSRENQPNLFAENYLDGLLKQWTCSRGTHFRVNHHTTNEIYAILVPNFLFILDKSYYPFPASSSNTKNKWYSSTAGILLQKSRLRRHPDQSAPQLVLLTPSQTMKQPQFPLDKAKWVIDLNNIAHVRSVKDHPNENVFEVSTKSGYTMCYETPTTQTMLQWITHFNRLLHDNKNKPTTVTTRAESTLWYRHAKQHSILQSGLLYMKKDYSQHYASILCILTNKGLILYDILKRKRWTSERTDLDFYRQRTIISLKNAYIYSGQECLLDQLVINKNEPLYCFQDGMVTESAQTVDCVFVIWKKSKRHFIASFREYLSLFKLGHRLGNRGTFWVFKARNRQEKEAWVCALHQEYNSI